MASKRTLGVLLLATAIITCLASSTASAWDETDDIQWPSDPNRDFGCLTCHHPAASGAGSTGPHGGYTAATRACSTCHTLHDAPGSYKLLPGDTVKAACAVCHDGTGGRGVYGTIAARGLPVGGDHSIETTSVVPGGDAVTGGSASMAFRGPGATLTCSDCHSPHANDMVTPFLGERQRDGYGVGLFPVWTSSRLLRQHPGGVTTPALEYGSDWCLACHSGRASGLPTTHNHPVESSIVSSDPASYQAAAIVGPGPYPTSVTTIGPMGIDTSLPGYNRGYLWPYPRTGAQAGRLPICQQCHEDTRYVGDLTPDGIQAVPSTASITPTIPGGPMANGLNPNDNPRFQNFPHETQGYRMLVEATTTAYSDDLCLNCHPVVALP